MSGRVRLPPLRAGGRVAAEAESSAAAEKSAAAETPRAWGAPDRASEAPRSASSAARWYPVVAFGITPLAMLLLGFAGTPMVAAGFPRGFAAARSAEAAVWRVLHAVIADVPQGVVIMTVFSYTFRMDVRTQVRVAAVLWAAWSANDILSHSFVEQDSSTAAVACRAVSWCLFLPLWLLPERLSRGMDKVGDASTRDPVARRMFLLAVLMYSISSSLSQFVDTSTAVLLALFGLIVTIFSCVWSLHKDPPGETLLSEWYTTCLAGLSVALSFLVFSLINFLVTELDQTDALDSAITALSLGGFLLFCHVVQYAFARRALPERFRSVALFPIQVFEDMFGEFFFVNARVFSDGYFVLLALQLARTLGRDTGFFDEVWRIAGNVWRRWRGQDVEERAIDATVEVTRIWLQNVVSEVSAMFLFVGVIAAENAFGLEELEGDGSGGSHVGMVTGLDGGDRLALLGGYAVVLACEAAVHVVVYVWVRRRLVEEQALLATYAMETGDGEGHEMPRMEGSRRATVAAMATGAISVRVESGRLIRRHGVYLVATMLFVGASTLRYVRQLRVDYA